MKIKKEFKKIISLLLIIGLNWAGLSAISETRAYFNDIEISENNIFQAGTLDFSLNSTDDFSPKVNLGQDSFRTIIVNDFSTMDYNYRVRVENPVGDLCPYLFLEDNISSAPQQLLANFISNEVLYPDESEWIFTASLNTPIDSDWENQVCSFDLVYEGWQDNINYGEGGFSDVEKIPGTVESEGEITPPPPSSGDVIINEIMWMGSKDNPDVSPSYDGPKDQWIELKNVSGEDLHLKGWYLTYKKESSGNENKLFEIKNDRVVKDGEYFLISHYNKSNSAINVQRDNTKAINDFDYGKFQIKLYTNKDKIVLIDVAGSGNGEPTVGDKNNYYSMERNDDPGDGTDYNNWHTCLDQTSTALYWDSGRTERGTPGAANFSD